MKTPIYLAFALLYSVNLISCHPQFSVVQASPTATSTRAPHLPGRPFRYIFSINRSVWLRYDRTLSFLLQVETFAQGFPPTQPLPDGGQLSYEGANLFKIVGKDFQYQDVVACVDAMYEYYDKSRSGYGVDVEIIDGFYLEGTAFVGGPQGDGGGGGGIVGVGGGGGGGALNGTVGTSE